VEKESCLDVKFSIYLVWYKEVKFSSPGIPASLPTKFYLNDTSSLLEVLADLRHTALINAL
jgi:hypothetical protein